MKTYYVNPNIKERVENDKLILFNMNNRALLILSKKAADIFYNIKNGVDQKIEESSKEIIGKILDSGFLSERPDFMDVFTPLPSVERFNNPKMLYDMYSKDFHNFQSPIGVLWSITQHCNLSCPYCHASSSKTKYKELPFSQLKEIADQLISAGVFEVIINGGEPFLHKDIFTLIEYIRGKFLLAINTNGTIVNNDIASKLNGLGVLVGVSLDGHNEKVMSITRGGGVFDIVVNAINLLIKHSVITHVLVTVTKYNLPYLSEITSLVRELGVKIITFQNLHPAGAGKKTYQQLKLTASQENDLLSIIFDISEKFQDMTINTTELLYFSLQKIAVLYNPSDKKPKNLFSCTACSEGAYIDAAGDIYPCVALPTFKLGNVIKDGLINTWQNSECANAIRKLQNISVEIIEPCNGCDKNYICNGGCIGDSLAIHNNEWFKLHPSCPKNFFS